MNDKEIIKLIFTALTPIFVLCLGSERSKQSQDLRPYKWCNIPENGQKFVSYTEFIPLLVEAFKEQQQTITIMQDQIEFLRNESSDVKSAMITSTDGFEKTNDANTLFQNTPNPFLEETRIENPELMNESWKD